MYSTIQHLLNESPWPPKVTVIPFAELTSFITTNCSEWLSEAGPRIAWRGIRLVPFDGLKDRTVDRTFKSSELSFVRSSRSNRRPKDMGEDIHNALDAGLKSMGLVANRSNSLFVSGSKTNTEEYGLPYAIFPIGPFHYTWSPTIEDAYHSLDSMSYFSHHAPSVSLMKGVIRMMEDPSCHDPWVVRARQMALEMEPTSTDFEWILDHDVADSFFVSARTTPSVVARAVGYQGDNGTLTQAIDSGNEIMIHCGSALYIPETSLPSKFK